MRNLQDINVLVVDDEELLRKNLARNLELEGFSVFTAACGREALPIIMGQRIDFVLSDIRMPNGDGIELLEQIKEHNPGVPIVLLASGFTEHSREDVLAKGAIDLMKKPIDIDGMVELIKSLFPL